MITNNSVLETTDLHSFEKIQVPPSTKKSLYYLLFKDYSYLFPSKLFDNRRCLHLIGMNYRPRAIWRKIYI